MRLAICSIILLSFCRLPIPESEKYSRMSLRYADGSGNIYVITIHRLEYMPVKPLQSSSGIYDGGEPVSKEIPTALFTRVRLAFEKAEANKAIRIKNRVKMSGVLSITDNGKNREFIIKPRCNEQSEIEAALKDAKAFQK